MNFDENQYCQLINLEKLDQSRQKRLLALLASWSELIKFEKPISMTDALSDSLGRSTLGTNAMHQDQHDVFPKISVSKA